MDSNETLNTLNLLLFHLRSPFLDFAAWASWTPKASSEPSDDTEYYPFGLDPAVDVTLVSTRAGFHRALADLERADLTGMDAEFLPVSVRSETKLALVQVRKPIRERKEREIVAT